MMVVVVALLVVWLLLEVLLPLQPALILLMNDDGSLC